MFAPEPEILLLRRMFNCVFDRLERKLDSLTVRQYEQDIVINDLSHRLDALELAKKVQRDRFDEIEYMVNPYSSDGESICNYYMNRSFDEDEV